MQFLYSTVSSIWTFIAETLFPQSSLEKEIEKLQISDLQGFLQKGEKTKDGIDSLLSYKEPRVRKFIEMIKYKANKKAVLLAGELFSEEILSLFEEKMPGSEQKFILSIIPASQLRIKKRGFDQNKVLASSIMKHASNFLEYRPEILYRKREVHVQSEIKSRKERLENMRDVFEVKEDIKGKTIIVIDDVTTTGATLKDARRALRTMGAKKIYCIALAH